MTWKLVTYLKDYCANCSLAGFAYIANQNLHFTERIFWLLCVVLSSVGSYLLISQFDQDFQSKAVSIVYESLPPHVNIHFPSVSVCDIINRYDIGEDVESYVRSLGSGIGEDYNYDVETFISYLIFPYLYHEGNIKARCDPYVKCAKCAQCPSDDYRALLIRYGANCSDIFHECTLAGRSFDCCAYFLPLFTPSGRCFMLNSLQNNKPGSSTWLNTIIDPTVDQAVMHLASHRPMQVSVLNAEDIPHTALTGVSLGITDAGQHKTFQVSSDDMTNDHDVREVQPEYRKCRFPDELLPGSAFRSYSFSTCLSDCVREFQLSLCNCTPMTLNPYKKAGRDCDLQGYYCLEKHSMVKPDAKSLVRWARSKDSCQCLPSCKESDIRVIYESISDFNRSSEIRSVTLTMPIVPTERYRRQALRTRLDIVVTIGGILGLFLGASILSGIEFVYYFTVRLCDSLWMDKQAEQRHQRQQQQQQQQRQQK